MGTDRIFSNSSISIVLDVVSEFRPHVSEIERKRRFTIQIVIQNRVTKLNLSPREFAVDVVRKLTDAGFRALWAGGCVRDLVSGFRPTDYDVATTATPDDVRRVFGRKNTVPVGESFGVMLVIGPKSAGTIEVATFRREGEYLDGRRPNSVEFCTPEEDAHRRDFTINGMFYDPLTEEILDYVGGRADLDNKILRCIGDPEDRFYEDKLRMLRAVRFTARFHFQLEDRTARAIRKHAPDITVVSVERIAHELLKMLEHENRRRAVELALDLDLWPMILPEIQLAWPVDRETETRLRILDSLRDPTPELALSVLCAELSVRITGELCRRIKLSNDQRERITWLVENQSSLERADQLPLHRLKQLLVHPCRRDLLELTRTRQFVEHGSSEGYEFCERYLRETPPGRIDPEPLLTGGDLIHLGLKPGREFKQLLEQVRNAQLDEQVSSRDEALDFVARLRQNPQQDQQ